MATGRTDVRPTRAERNGWYRHLGAWLICVALLGVIHLVGGNRDETAKLFDLPRG